MEHAYDHIGSDYAKSRRSDPRLAARILEALGGADRVINVGAGAGSYEPGDRFVVAAEPSMMMLRQRSPGAAPAVRACAEALPFRDGAFAAALAVLTVHHWRDWRVGLREAIRVSRGQVVLLTWDPESAGFWLVHDYVPHVLEADRRRFPSLDALQGELADSQVLPVRIPHDCADGFMGAFWRRPAAYLDPQVRGAISSLADGSSEAALGRLAHDLASGAWAEKYGELLGVDELDLGYRLVIGRGKRG
jgi:SAM-dependent methyltransferase